MGFVWGEQDGEVLFHADEAVTGAIRAVFERFAEFGSARRVWLWFRSERLSFPLQTLVRRLAALYPDEVIAGILNRQERKTATGERFTANHVGNLRRYRNIPRFQPPAEPPHGR